MGIQCTHVDNETEVEQYVMTVYLLCKIVHLIAIRNFQFKPLDEKFIKAKDGWESLAVEY